MQTQKLTTAQAQGVLNTFALTNKHGQVQGTVAVCEGTNVLATYINTADPFFASSLIRKSQEATLLQYTTGTSGCTEDSLEVVVGNTYFTFRLKPVTEVPALAG
jgi:hypothetical protein